MTTVGILALQGGFSLHGQVLDQLGVSWRAVRKPRELLGLCGLIIPGGESSTLTTLMNPLRWQQAIIDFSLAGKVVFGTCAGMILMANQLALREESLGLMDIHVKRNAYGRQLDSFGAYGQVIDSALPGDTQLELVCIRAPKVLKVASSVQVLVRYQDQPMLLQQGKSLVASFHPELSSARRVHQYFVSMMNEVPAYE